MPFGGFSPFPLRLGGGTPVVKTIYNGINSALGTAYDTSDDSTVTAETQGEARAIAQIWSLNQRVANQYDPVRMTDYLPRWEKILNLPPRAGDTDAVRRERVAGKLAALGNPNPSNITTSCQKLLGDLFSGVEYVPLGSQLSHWAATGEPTRWSSTFAHIVVRVYRPASLADGDFYAKMSALTQMLDDFLPAWTTFSWGVASSTGNSFRLDEPHNLDQQTFGT